MSTIKDNIKETIEELTILDHAHARLKTLSASIADMNKEWKKLDKQLDKELDDINNLESLSIKGLFHKVLGSKEEQLEKERQEYLALNLRIKELNKSLEIAEFEEEILAKKVEKRDKVLQTLNKLKEERLKEILRTNAAQKKPLLKLLDEEDRTIAYRQEIQEAIAAGNDAQSRINSVLQHLAKAEEWGQWDTFNSKNRYYKRMKHNALDTAASQAIHAQHFLKTFKQELADVGYQATFDLQVDSFQSFSNIFFDNLISDWIVQRKISSVLNGVKNTASKVNMLMQSLNHELQKVDAKLSQLAKDKHQLLIT